MPINGIQGINPWVGGKVVTENGLETGYKGLGCYIEDFSPYSGPVGSRSPSVLNVLGFYKVNTLDYLLFHISRYIYTLHVETFQYYIATILFNKTLQI